MTVIIDHPKMPLINSFFQYQDNFVGVNSMQYESTEQQETQYNI